MCDSVRVWVVEWGWRGEELGCVVLGGGRASYGCLCDGSRWRASGRVGCIRSRV